MWRELIQKLTAEHTFFPPASPEQIAGAEVALGVTLPNDLKSLLAETNGVDGEYGLGLIWPVERIQKDNLDFRNNSSFAELYMPFDSLLFFADAGNGDQFAYRILDGAIRDFDIFGWDHELDSRTWIASSLESYLSGAIKRQLKWT